jgi:acetyl-CoA carboxylase carboxyltransferase component
MYADHGGCPSGGVVVKWDTSKKQCIVVANDATRKAGAWFPITAKKNLRAQENGKSPPIIYLVDSAGVFTAWTKSSQTKNILEDFLEIMLK